MLARCEVKLFFYPSSLWVAYRRLPLVHEDPRERSCTKRTAGSSVVGKMTLLEGDGTTHLFNQTDRKQAKSAFRDIG